MSEYTIGDYVNETQRMGFINPPKYTWKCELHPGTYWHVQEGKQPNAFHRFMQRLCFGVKWSRIDD